MLSWTLSRRVLVGCWMLLAVGAPLSVLGQLTGDKVCSTLMCVSAIVNGSTTTYELISLNQLGWMAIGFGSVMPNTPMVILWPDGNGNIILSQRTAPALVEPSPDPSPPRIATVSLASSNLQGNTPSMSFTVPSNGNNQTQDLIWAYGVTPPEASSDANIQQHLDAGNFTLDLSKPVTISPSSTSISLSSATATPSSSATAHPSPATAIDTSARYRSIVLAHAVMCTLGLAVFVPLAALVARWSRVYTAYWLRSHWIINSVLAMPLTVIGFVLAPLAAAERGGGHANDAHQVAGIIVFFCFLCQCGLGLWVHTKQPRQVQGIGQHPARNIAHIVLGLATIALAFYQTWTGIDTEWGKVTGTPAPSILHDFWIIWMAVISIIYCAGFILLRRQLVQERLGFDLPVLSATPPLSRVNSLTNPSAPSDSSRTSSRPVSHRIIVRAEDDGTHDVWSDVQSQAPTIPPPPRIEMREMGSTMPLSIRPLAVPRPASSQDPPAY